MARSALYTAKWADDAGQKEGVRSAAGRRKT